MRLTLVKETWWGGMFSYVICMCVFVPKGCPHRLLWEYHCFPRADSSFWSWRGVMLRITPAFSSFCTAAQIDRQTDRHRATGHYHIRFQLWKYHWESGWNAVTKQFRESEESGAYWLLMELHAINSVLAYCLLHTAPNALYNVCYFISTVCETVPSLFNNIYNAWRKCAYCKL